MVRSRSERSPSMSSAVRVLVTPCKMTMGVFPDMMRLMVWVMLCGVAPGRHCAIVGWGLVGFCLPMFQHKILKGVWGPDGRDSQGGLASGEEGGTLVDWCEGEPSGRVGVRTWGVSVGAGGGGGPKLM